MSEILKLTATQLAKAIKNKEVSSTSVVKAYLDRVESVDPKVSAFVNVLKDPAMKQASEIDKGIASGKDMGPLAGVPIAIKDNMHIEGVKTTCSSKILENYVAPYDSSVIEALKRAGAVFIGKTNMDEFAMGSSTENSSFFTTKNPWDTSRIPGGSSGGSAAAVAAQMTPLALGSDTGGSIRQPASCCGVVGLKPTYGRISRFGLVAFASSLDQIGPFARNVEDATLLLSVIAGHDKRDATSVPEPVPDYNNKLQDDLRNVTIGIPKEYFIDGMDKEVETAVKAALDVFKHRGATIKEISLPNTKYAVSVYYILATSEASANLARYDGVKYGLRVPGDSLIDEYMNTRGAGFGSEVKRRIMLGTYALSAGYYDAYYGKAQKVRALIRQDFDKAFESVDLIVTPTAPTPAFKIGEKSSDPLQMYLSDIFTISCNLAGLPGISIPCGFSSGKLPIGLQILGKTFDETTILQAGYQYQKDTKWHEEEPKI